MLLEGRTLHVWYTRVGDAPERILTRAVDLSADDWHAWRPGAEREVIRPTCEWEGAGLELTPSGRGPAYARMRQLRDPYILDDRCTDGTGTGALWLFYAAAGEAVIGVTRLPDGDAPDGTHAHTTTHTTARTTDDATVASARSADDAQDHR